MTLNFIGGGSGIDITGSEYSSSIGGYNNDIFISDHAIIGGGFSNTIFDGDALFVGGGHLKHYLWQYFFCCNRGRNK